MGASSTPPFTVLELTHVIPMLSRSSFPSLFFAASLLLLMYLSFNDRRGYVINKQHEWTSSLGRDPLIYTVSILLVQSMTRKTSHPFICIFFITHLRILHLPLYLFLGDLVSERVGGVRYLLLSLLLSLSGSMYPPISLLIS